MSISFRPCTAEDCETIVPLIHQSGPETFNYVFAVGYQEQAIEFLKYCFRRGNNQWGYRCHIAVEKDDEIIATGTLWHRYNNKHFLIQSVLCILNFYGLIQGLRVIVRGLKVEKIIPPPGEDVAYLAHLCVAEPHRGKGIIDQLINYFLTITKEKSLSVAALDVEEDNRSAKRAYERRGFQFQKLRTSNLKNKFGHVASHYYMELHLSNG